MKTIWCFSVAAAAVALLAGSFFAGSVAADKDEKPTPPEAKALSKANNQFGLDLFGRLHQDGKNTFISPTSLSVALQMTAMGARGETLAEMERVMRVGDIDLRKSNRALLDQLGSRDGVTLTVANSLWGDPARITFHEPFLKDVVRYFDSEARPASFSDPKTVDLINDWISGKTNGLIKDMLDKIPEDAVAYLINAIYFKGDWSVPFDKDKTKEADFHLAGGGTKKIPLMMRRDRMVYGTHGGHQIAKLPYGKDERAAMWIVLPDKGTSLDSLVKELDADKLDAWRRSVHLQQGTLKLPRFQMRYNSGLIDTLKSLGVQRAFNWRNADFSRLGESHLGPLFIDKVLHEAVVKVNEEGTVAAAATIVSMSGGSPRPPEPFVMTCDRPFLFFITDEPTGSILFAGAVHNPETLD